MHRHLLIKAFERARENTGYTKRTPLSRELSDIIFKKSKQQYGDKSLRTYYNLALENSKRDIVFSDYVIQSLCEYVGCEDFKNFKEKYPSEDFPENNRNSIWEISICITRRYGVYILLLLVILGFMVMFSLHEPKWMAWQEDHYVEVPFDTDKFHISALRLYDEDRILYFKKITPDCETEFFKPDGLENLWYGKSSKGELEYFTALGKHPETGKTLKPITVYMIRKYICETYK